jgi:toxin ParE1/3/4
VPTITIRPLARIDTIEIWEYIAEDSEAQADAFVDRLDGQFALLAIQPKLGRLRDELGADLRSFPFNPYTIFYQTLPDGIGVVRVLHGARDLEAQFRPRIGND